MSQRRNRPFAYPIEPKNTEENLNASKGIKYRRARLFERLTTTAAYVDSEIFDKRLLSHALITIDEVGNAQSIFYKVLACIDPSDWHEIQPETSLAAGAHVPLSVSDSWAYLKLQAKNNSGAGVVTAFVSGGTP